jgi:hypothetical protein
MHRMHVHHTETAMNSNLEYAYFFNTFCAVVHPHWSAERHEFFFPQIKGTHLLYLKPFCI